MVARSALWLLSSLAAVSATGEVVTIRPVHVVGRLPVEATAELLVGNYNDRETLTRESAERRRPGTRLPDCIVMRCSPPGAWHTVGGRPLGRGRTGPCAQRGGGEEQRWTARRSVG